MEINRPKWHKPTLLVLVRGKKQEVVLQYCKSYSIIAGPGNSGWQGFSLGCRTSSVPYECSAIIWT